jgi:hypothetical protein
MTIRITIETGNDAFQPSWQDEVARLLRQMAARFESGDGPSAGFGRTLLDHNSHNCGVCVHDLEKDA